MATCKISNTRCHLPYGLLGLAMISFFFLKFPFAVSFTYNYSTLTQQDQNLSYQESQIHNLSTNLFCPSNSNYGSDRMDFSLSPTDFAFTDSADTALCFVTQKEAAVRTIDASTDVPQDELEGKLRLVACSSMEVLFIFIVSLSLWFLINDKVNKEEDQGVLSITLNRGAQDEGLLDLAMPITGLEKEDEAEVFSYKFVDNDDGIDSYKFVDNDDGIDLYYSMDKDDIDLGKFIENVAGDLHKSMDDEGFDGSKCIEEDFIRANGSQKFSFEELVDATNNFSEKLGEGGFGAVCKGFLKELNCYVAVKRASRNSRQGIKEFTSEVTIISQLRHRNIVQLKGWCYERKELLLVYEFMSKGSLDHHLFKENSLLTWEVRYRIALGLASGLRYLQEDLEEYVVHRDIKASNVMLDSNFNPKLGDFGLARWAERGRGPNETPLAGTPGYVAPEYSVTHKASKESDIYSFGIVALEIACGRKIIDLKAREDEINLREWVWDLYGKGKLLEAADRRLNGDFDKKQVECLMIVGLWCAHPYEKSRPSIEKAIHVLSFIVPLPDLPSSMPMIIDFDRLSMSSVGTNLVRSPNSFSEDEKLGKRGVVALDERLDNPHVDKWKRSKAKKEDKYGCRMFCYEELVHATDNFSEQNKLEQKATGVVYRGFLKEVNSFVAVNVVSKGYIPGLELIEGQVKVMDQLRHENLVKIVGWCYCDIKSKLILVHEFMSNGNLDSHLFKTDSHLTWEKRYKIAKGVALGLLYLSKECLLDEAIESSNVLLDSDFNVKLGNFGLQTLANFCNMFLHTFVLIPGRRTQGYALSAERYVHSFGIIALQIACGKKDLEFQWIWELYGKRTLNKAADPRLKGDFEKVEMETLMIVGLWCAHPVPKFRPSIREAIQVLDFKDPLPLPSKFTLPSSLLPLKLTLPSSLARFAQ